MSAVGKKKGLLEVFKFGTYIAIPIVMMYAFANNSENLERIIRNVREFSLSYFLFQISFFYCLVSSMCDGCFKGALFSLSFEN